MQMKWGLVLLALGTACRDTLITDTGDVDTTPIFATVDGSVLLPDGAPADGALVALGEQAAIAGTDGTFAFIDVAPGAYDLRAELGGYAPAVATVEAVAGENASVSLTLSALEDAAPLITALSGVPLPVPRGGTADLTATTPTDGALTWEWSVDADFSVDGDSSTAVLTAPDAPSVTATVLVRATDASGASDEASLSVSTAPNAVPVIESLVASPQQALPGGTVSVLAEATDADDVDLTFDWTVPAGWASEGEGTAITLVAPDVYGATAVVELSVSDAWGGTARRTVPVSTIANDGPAISSLTALPTVVARGGQSTLTVIATDPQGSDLDIEWTGPEAWDIASPSSDTTVVTGPDLPGNAATFQVRVTDDDGAVAMGEVVVSTASNSAPEITGIQATPNPAEPGQVVALTFTADDFEDDSFTGSWQGPAGWSLVDQGNTATVTAPMERGAQATIALTVTDSYGASRASSIELVTNPNLVPVIASVLAVPSQLEPGGTTALSVDASDPNGDPLTVEWAIPDGWTFDGTGASGILTAPDAEGDAVVGVTVTDPYGGSATGSVAVSVEASNQAPVIEPPVISTLSPGELRELIVDVSDPEGDPVELTWQLQGQGWQVDADGVLGSLSAPLPGEGVETATLVLTATDGALQTRVTVPVALATDGTSCASLASAGEPSGAYWLSPDGSLDAAYVAGCDMDPDGAWTLMYKRSAGVPITDLPGQLTGGSVNPYDLDLADRDGEDRDFASAALPGSWGSFTEARVEVVENGQVMQWMHYDTAGSTPTSFFAKDRLLDSSWQDMVPQHVGAALYWSVEGLNAGRRFYINRQWGGCPNDEGWLVVGGGATHTCPFDSATGILYSTADGVTNLTSGSVSQADALLVWVREAPAGVSRDTAVATCADLPDSVTEDTLWWVDPDGEGGSEPFRTLCDVDGGGWTMAYKKSSGVTRDPYDTWVSGSENTGDPDALDLDGHVADFSTPAITTGWDAFSEARIDVLVDGAAVHSVTFDLDGATNVDWMTKARMTASTWTDIATEPQNWFGVFGDGNNQRHFFINRNYGGCPADVGWLVVTGNRSSLCAWEARHEVRYAVPPTAQNYTTGDTERADAMAVFLR